MTSANPQPRPRTHPLRQLALLLLLAAIAWCALVCYRIATVARTDEAQPADAIAVFGAAQYGGRPSPILHARLDHVVELYRKQIAPVVITLGGNRDKDSGSTEGGVGRDYLLANGVPLDKIIAETSSTDTGQQVDRLVEIARENNFSHIVVVSDGTHLYRIRALCRAADLDVYTSPRPAYGHISALELAERYLHEVLGYTLFRLHLNTPYG